MSRLSTKEIWYDARHPPADLKGLPFKDKAVLVTGAHGASLGHNAAVKYAALGANPLILAVRSLEKGEQAKAAIMRKTGCSDIFMIEILDLSTFASVKDFADRITKRVPALHVVQNSGGVAPWTYAKSPDGYEITTQVSVLSTTLLTLLLLPKLQQTAAIPSPDGYRPHITFMDSIAIFDITNEMLPSGQTLIQRCDDESKWDSIKQYFLIKLATWYAVKGVAELCENSGIIVNATCPGLCKTNVVRDLPLVYRMFMAARMFFVGRSAEQGSRSLVSATILGPESHGQFWNNDRYHPMTPFLESERSAEMCRETWNEIKSILREHTPAGMI
ncbi:NAD(P)-binding protein [Nemania abortiva]|nr:NAD(P)-binding protein [Nemania abortiva]